jgi:hypothetical protein
MKASLLLISMVVGASAFAPQPAFKNSKTVVYNEPGQKGAGGMFDTRDPEPKVDADPRKSISAAPSFEEYLKQRKAEGN